MSEEETKAPAPKRNSLPSEEVRGMCDGLPSYEKKAWTVIGKKDGVRIAVPKTSNISRVYMYANDDYTIIPQHESVRVFSEEDRREHRRGGVMAEIDFERGTDAARDALRLMVEAVRTACASTPAVEGDGAV